MKAKTLKLESIQDIEKIRKTCMMCLNSFVKDKKHKIEVVISNAKSQRNIKQNALLHALFRDISIEAMNLSEPIYLSPNGWKHFFKMNMLQSKEIVQVYDDLVTVPQSTANLTIQTCKDFITDIIEWCKAMDIEVYVKTKDYDELFNR